MKKAFQIFGLALLASSLLFTACKKDDEEEETNNNEQPAVAQGNLTTVFDGTTTTDFGYLKGLYATKADTVNFRTRAAVNWADDGTITMPYFDAVMSSYAEGDKAQWMVRYMEYGDNGTEVTALTEYWQGVFTGNWNMYSINKDRSIIGEFDATNVTLDYTIVASMYNAYQWYVERKEQDQVTMKDLIVTASKFHYDRASSK